MGLHDGSKIKEILEHLHAKYRTTKCVITEIQQQASKYIDSTTWAYMMVARSKRYLNTCRLNIELPNVSLHRFNSKHQNI